MAGATGGDAVPAYFRLRYGRSSSGVYSARLSVAGAAGHGFSVVCIGHILGYRQHW